MIEADPLYSSLVANCVFNAFSSYTAIILNILTVHAIRKTSSLPKPLKTLLLSLAVSDLGVGLLVQPLRISWMIRRLQQNTEDKSLYVLYYFALAIVNSSFFTVMAIGVDRFLAIQLHLRYQELVTHKRVVVVLVSIWILSIFLSLIYLWISAYIANVVIIIILGLCFISTALVYCRIYLAVRRHRNQMQAVQVQGLHEAQNGEMVYDLRREIKSAFSTFYIYLVLLVCCLPEYCATIAQRITGPSPALDRLLLYSGTLVLVNSSLNPVIYCWKMRNIRQTIKDIVRNIFTR